MLYLLDVTREWRCPSEVSGMSAAIRPTILGKDKDVWVINAEFLARLIWRQDCVSTVVCTVYIDSGRASSCYINLSLTRVLALWEMWYWHNSRTRPVVFKSFEKLWAESAQVCQRVPAPAGGEKDEVWGPAGRSNSCSGRTGPSAGGRG